MDETDTYSLLTAIAIGMLVEDNTPEIARASVQILCKIVSNAQSGSDPKFRRLPVANEKIKQNILGVSGASEFLDAIGFRRPNGGDFVLEDDSKLGVASIVLNEVASALPQAISVPSKPIQQTLVTDATSISSKSGGVDADYEARKKEAETRQIEIKRRLEEDRKKKEALQKQFKAEQRESKERPVTASHAVQVVRHDARASSGGDGKIRYTNSDREFQSVISSQTSVIANFTASWCGPCQAIAPMIEEMARTHPKITFIKIDIDENQETPSKFNVSAVPTFILFKNGQVAGEVKGANPQGVQGLVAKA